MVHAAQSPAGERGQLHLSFWTPVPGPRLPVVGGPYRPVPSSPGPSPGHSKVMVPASPILSGLVLVAIDTASGHLRLRPPPFFWQGPHVGGAPSVLSSGTCTSHLGARSCL